MSIDIEHLSVAYGTERVITDLSLSIAQGCFFTLLGPSGCGKTTLLRTIAGFIQASNGHLRFSGKDVTRLPPHKRNIGMVFQDYALFPDKTVAENVAYGLRARGERGPDMQRKVTEALARVGLETFAARHPAALSGGQRQRVALARALVIKPAILLMDEPLSNLDAKLRVQIRETMIDLQREAAITTMFVTHDQEEALAMSDQIGVMQHGAIAQLGTPQEVYGLPQTSYVADFVGSANRLRVTLRPAQDHATLCYARIGTTDILVTDALGTASAQGILILRPEDLKLASVPHHQLQSLPARVQQRQYLGAKTRYRLVLDALDAAPGQPQENAAEVVAELHGPGHDAFRAGQAVHLGIDPMLARVIAA